MKRTATAKWSGSLKDGSGSLSTQSSVLSDTPYSFEGRFEDADGKSGTNPEELIGAAHAGCFTMQLSHMLAQEGHPADMLETKASVTVSPKDGGGFEITQSHLFLTGKVPGIDHDTFMKLATTAKAGCPVSVALAGTEISLEAKLEE
ncbi:OsmC family protein [Ponticaulis sp.]|uniref:OsmC family protein n=1 Tax=Ponticaulis sp. TaxID=2020902 RepID=UPI000B6872DE|nr:OsmC family protein [Ponticaulis sp.]MAI91660.1 OsmC family peroxiredoxin [Ponticaulis sp.]OUX97225.1 MAG: OsmC family peroxiredoxin [Hyphomonadaceae bacterium TMED5]|tara:strand:+ start:54812 stop:55252 length:441 start_codon:yes stop_codon:yes gene_type:complete